MGAWAPAQKRQLWNPGALRAQEDGGTAASRRKWFQKRQRRRRQRPSNGDSDLPMETGADGAELQESATPAASAGAGTQSSGVMQQVQVQVQQLRAQLRHAEWHRRDAEKRLRAEKAITNGVIAARQVAAVAVEAAARVPAEETTAAAAQVEAAAAEEQSAAAVLVKAVEVPAATAVAVEGVTRVTPLAAAGRAARLLELQQDQQRWLREKEAAAVQVLATKRQVAAVQWRQQLECQQRRQQ